MDTNIDFDSTDDDNTQDTKYSNKVVIDQAFVETC